jgi:hypothetical protein
VAVQALARSALCGEASCVCARCRALTQPPPRRADALVAEVWQEEHRHEEAADKAAQVAEVAHRDRLLAAGRRALPRPFSFPVVGNRGGEEVDEEARDGGGAREGPRDRLEVEEEVGDEEAEEAEDGTGGADDAEAEVAGKGCCDEVAADACGAEK